MFRKAVTAFITFYILSGHLPLQAQIPVYSEAIDSMRAAAKKLFDELEKAGFRAGPISGPDQFTGTGICILTRAGAEKLKTSYPAALKNFGPEGVYIKADTKSVLLIGNTALAVHQGVYIYLEQLGFRFLLPGEIWNVIPKLNTVYKPLTILTKPHYDYRWISNGHGYGGNKKVESDFNTWAAANLLGGSFEIRTGHAYNEIVSGNAEIFKQHPEYFAQMVKKGELPVDPKFNVANRNLVNLVVEDASKRMEQYKKWGWSTNMISMEPSDGGGFCNTKECAAVGNTSEQVFYLTNAVARAMKIKYPGTWVGGLAYNEHILPPRFNMEQNIFLMVTNGFNRTQYSTLDLLKMWKKKIQRTGVYEYLSVYEGDNDLPGQLKAARTDWLKKTIRDYYDNGARAYLGESVIGWINRGPGQYLAAKLLWNKNVNTDSVRKDFFLKAFENAAPQIRKLYDSWQYYPHKLPVESDMAEWFALVHQAYIAATNNLVKKRIEQIKIYLLYVYLYTQLKKQATEESMMNVLRFANRNFESAAFATLPALVSLPGYSGFRHLGYYAGKDQAWRKDDKPYGSEELEAFFQRAKGSLKKGTTFSQFAKTGSFVKPEAVLKIPDKKFARSLHTFWGPVEYVFTIKEKSSMNFIELRSGYAANPAVSRNVEVNIFPAALALKGTESEKSLLHFEQTSKITKEQFSLQSLPPGTYVLKVNDQNKMFILEFAPAISYSMVMKPDEKLLTTTVANLNVFYFYVPSGVRNFRIHKTVIMKIISPAGRLLDHTNNKDEVIDIEVKPGEEGLWEINNQSGAVYIEGVPPYLGAHPAIMLVPASLKK
jgi:hypothetical protein